MAALLGLSAPAVAQAPLEMPVCGPEELRLASRYRDAAERHRTEPPAGAVAVTFEVNDVRLSGYKLEARALAPQVPHQGALLVLQGNAMLAEQILGLFAPFARAGLDVYIVDYRGFANSGGRPYLRAIVADYLSIAQQLSRESKGRLFVYGMSFGAGVALKVLNSGVEYKAAVVDAAPSRFLKVKMLCLISVNLLKCPDDYHPENNVPADVSRLLFLHGSSDSVIRTCDADGLKSRVEQKGGTFRMLDDFAHPFQDTPEQHAERSRVVLEFLSRHF
jgi:dienelactone hydrolase